MNLLIIGHARHGKDTVAEMLRDNYGLTFADSSRTAAEIFLFDKLRRKYGYQTIEECYQDRVNHRAEWFQEIFQYNRSDRTRLARHIMERSDVYVGMRNHIEIVECVKAKIFDAVIWVDACKRLPPESPDSFDVDFSNADYIVDNNGSEEELEVTVDTLMNELMGRIARGRRIYVAGPMRGYPYFNFPAFDAAKAELKALGFIVVSPADLDRQIGFDPMTLPFNSNWHDLSHCGFSLDDAIDRDLAAVRSCDAVYMLNGWEKSLGANAEYALARWQGSEVLFQKRSVR